jgi:HAMP domain-containing protein
MVLMLSIFTYVEYTHHRSTQLNNLSVLASYNGRVLEETLQHSMLKSDFTEVQRILDSVGSNENFRVVYILDTSGRVIFAPNNAGIGMQLDNQNPTCQPCHKLPSNERPSGIVVNEDGGKRLFRSMHPIENSPACTQCHDPSQRLIGLLLTDIYVAPFEAAFIADLRENLLWGISTILVSAIMANLIMGRLVIRRLKRVANALAGFGSGKRGLILEPGSLDEIGQLELDFNEMGQQIQTEEAENQALSEDLRRQTIQQQELLKRLITAQEDERKRVARELHDELGQSLSGLALHSEVIGQNIHSDPDRALEQLFLIRQLIDKTTQQMYELILALRPSVLDDLGLAAALRSHAERVLVGSGITFKLDTTGLNKRLPPSIEDRPLPYLPGGDEQYCQAFRGGSC